MKKYSFFTVAVLGVFVMGMSIASHAFASTYSGRCVDDPVLVQSSNSQYSLCSDLFNRNCPGGTLDSKTETNQGGVFEISCTKATQSTAQTCDPATASCAPGTIAPDGSVNTGNENGSSQATRCDPAEGPCQPGTIAPDGSVNVGTQNVRCDPAQGPCQPGTVAPDGSVNQGTTGSGSGGSGVGGSGSGGVGGSGSGGVGGSGSGTGGSGAQVKLINPLGSGTTNLESFLNSILDFVIRIGTVVVVLMMVYVGFKFVTAQGDPGEITKAREMLLWTVVGALVLLGAKVLAAGIEATVKALSVGG